MVVPALKAVETHLPVLPAAADTTRRLAGTVALDVPKPLLLKTAQGSGMMVWTGKVLHTPRARTPGQVPRRVIST